MLGSSLPKLHPRTCSLAPQPRPATNPGSSHCRRCYQTALRQSRNRPPTILRELPVLPLLTRHAPHPGAGRPIRLIKIHPHQPRPVSSPGLRTQQPSNLGDEGAQMVHHSLQIIPGLPDSDTSKGTGSVFAGYSIFFLSRLIIACHLKSRQTWLPPKAASL